MKKAIKHTQDIAELIKESRKAQGLTQLDLAAAANTGNRVIVDIENGKTSCQVQKVLDLLNNLGIELIADDGE